MDIRRGVKVPPGMEDPPILGRPTPIEGREDEREAPGVTGTPDDLGPSPFGVLALAIDVRGASPPLGGANPPEGKLE